MKLNKSTIIFAISILLIVVTLWFQRYLFFNKYDHEYMHDYYSFSQWALPQSSRIMGDGALFAYSGYSLTKEYKPFSINPETPIFAKLFFGYSAKLFGNQQLAQALFMLLLLWGLDLLVKNNFKFSKNKRILLSLLVFTSAELQLQFVSTTLDLPQVMLFVWHLVFLFSLNKEKNKNLFNLIIAGLLLGFMSATKPALYVPFILLADTWYLYKNKLIKTSLIIYFMTGIGYLLPYLPVIISDGVSSFITAQKWVVKFYLSSDVIAPMGMVLSSIFTGMYKGWAPAEWRFLKTWNGDWAIGFISFAIYLYNWARTKKIKDTKLGTILITLFFVILVLIKLPFWPRYLIFLIPFFWILVLNYIKKEKYLFLLFIFPIISTTRLVYSSYQTPELITQYIQTANHEELYNYLSKAYKSKLTRKELVKKEIESYIDVRPNIADVKLLSEEKNIYTLKQIYEVRYSSLFGFSTVIKELQFNRENGQWKINSISNNRKDISLNEDNVNAICINPTKVSKWDDIYNSISDYYGLGATDIMQIAMSFTPRDYCIPILQINEENVEFPKGIEIISN